MMQNGDIAGAMQQLDLASQLDNANANATTVNNATGSSSSHGTDDRQRWQGEQRGQQGQDTAPQRVAKQTTALYYNDDTTENEHEHEITNDSIHTLPRIEEESEEQISEEDDTDTEDDDNEENNNEDDNEVNNDHTINDNSNDTDCDRNNAAAPVAKNEEDTIGDPFTSASNSDRSLSATRSNTSTVTSTDTTSNDDSKMLADIELISLGDTLDDVHDKLELIGWTIDPYGQMYLMPQVGYDDIENNPQGRNQNYFLDEKSFHRYLRETYGWHEGKKATNYHCNNTPTYCNTTSSFFAILACVNEKRKEEKEKKRRKKLQQLSSQCFP
mmetsp:Transcript_25850/g.29862  ORF Transcript_25850/g.29862 Transcript_25850/m.29862 type:complete len:328 (+) Transcript_25850:2-985(+)